MKLSQIFLNIILINHISFIYIPKSYSQNFDYQLKKSIALGFDLYGPAEKVITSNKGNYEVTCKPQISSNLLIVSEGGLLDFSKKVSDNTKSFNYKASGKYIRLGLDYNLFRRNQANERNFILVGTRVGYSITQHKGSNIIITDIVWGNRNYSFAPSNVKSTWIEITGGIHSQIGKYIAIEWQLRLKYLLNKQSTTNVEPIYIAGFGKGIEKFVIGFSYNLYFTIIY